MNGPFIYGWLNAIQPLASLLLMLIFLIIVYLILWIDTGSHREALISIGFFLVILGIFYSFNHD